MEKAKRTGRNNSKTLRSIDLGLDFENWICDILPKRLNLSPSKETAVKVKFGGFADYARLVAAKAPKEFNVFFSEIVKKFDEISHWRAAKGTKCIEGYGMLSS